MINYYLEAFTKNYVNFSGRARRSEYWYYLLFNAIVGVSLAVIGAAVGDGLGLIPYVIYILAAILPSLAMVVRRLHDVGKSGWFYFVGLIPLIGAIWLIVLFCTDSQPGENNWGPNPKGIGNHDDIDEINNIGKPTE